MERLDCRSMYVPGNGLIDCLAGSTLPLARELVADDGMTSRYLRCLVV